MQKDLGPKKARYRDVLNVKEYFLFDPWEEYLSPQLLGYSLDEHDYQEIERVDGRLPSKVLGLLLEADGEVLRFVDSKTGERLPIPSEVVSAREQAEAGRRREVKARRQAEVARQKAEAEVERLRRELDKLRKRLPPNGSSN